MAVPKRRKSKSKSRMQARSHKRKVVVGQKCPECGAPKVSHRICPACGYYSGRQVLTVKAED